MVTEKPIEIDASAAGTQPEAPRAAIAATPAVSSSTGSYNEQIADPAIDIRDLSVFYGRKQAITGMSLTIPAKQVTALIGPSGCGKSTLLRSINRMNELIPGVRVEGEIVINGVNVYDKRVDPVEVRRSVGMVFQKPNPFPKSIYENVAFGARINGYRGNMDELVERSLKQAALWDEVKDDLKKKSGLALSGGQQQRLCIARTIATSPDVILMDEPCSALDPIATLKVEDLMRTLAKDFTIVIVTHNMQQAARVSEHTAFLLAESDLIGRLVEYAPTEQIFMKPQDKRTEDYITGRFG